MGLRLIALDRPGYGGSSPKPGRTVADCAADVRTIAEDLGISRCGVWGFSGGGPHALACAALLPDVVVAVVASAAISPLGGQLSHQQEESFRAVILEGNDARPGFDAAREEFLRPSVEDLEDAFGQVLGPRHRAEAAEFARYRFASLRCAMADSAEGLFEDAWALVHDWGFTVSDVRGDARYCHGRRDEIVTIAHGEWFADHLPSAEVVFTEDDHLSMLLGGTEADFRWLADRLV